MTTVEPLYKHTLGTKDRMLINKVMLIPRGIQCTKFRLGPRVACLLARYTYLQDAYREVLLYNRR